MFDEEIKEEFEAPAQEQPQTDAPQNEKNKGNECSCTCELAEIKEKLSALAAENKALKEELEAFKKLPRFSVKTSPEDSGADAIKKIFRKR